MGPFAKMFDWQRKQWLCIATLNWKDFLSSEKLAKKIAWDDLSEIDPGCVESGTTQMLPENAYCAGFHSRVNKERVWAVVTSRVKNWGWSPSKQTSNGGAKVETNLIKDMTIQRAGNLPPGQSKL
jgi:hypothetical protein